MSGEEKLEEELSGVCKLNDDCTRYALCIRANTCRCLSWGRCELIRMANQTCISNLQCGPGLLCREMVTKNIYRCRPITYLEDLRMFPDQPENITNSMPDIEASFTGSFLVAGITATLVIVCVILAARFRCYPRNADCENIEMTSPSSTLVNTNTTQQLPTYASTSELKAPHYQPVVLPQEP